MGGLEYGADPERIAAIAAEVKQVSDRGVEVAVVVGGGNIYRGLSGAAAGMDRATGDYMGMLATVLNALALQDALEKLGAVTRVMSAIEISEVAEPYIRRRAMRHLEKGRIVIFAAGTGNPFFTTDTAAALRALEIHAEVILMAKNGVEGVYTADPRKVPDAQFIEHITHREAIEQQLAVMDVTALSLCMDNDLPIHVFNMDDEGNIDRIVCGERVGTVVCDRWIASSHNEFMAEAEERMAKSVEATRNEFSTVRTGRASRSCWTAWRWTTTAPSRRSSSSPTSRPARRGCSPSRPTTSPRSRRSRRAILESDVGLTPSNDGNLIRLTIPELTEERRRELVKVVHGIAEQGRVAIRNVRRDVKNDLRELKKEGDIGADDEHRAETELQKLTDARVGEIDSAAGGQGRRDPGGDTCQLRPADDGDAPLRRHHHRRQRALGTGPGAVADRRPPRPGPTRSRRACATRPGWASRS